MTDAALDGVAIRGIRACVPSAVRRLEDDGLIPDAAERERLIKSIGVVTRRVAPPGAMHFRPVPDGGEGLLALLGWERDSIDILILVTQSADYVIPATACALQDRLGLGSCLAFDINLGCSGYVYGLWTAASLLKTLKVNGRPARALLLAGDISTSKLLEGDRSTLPLFGDAGSATALEAGDAAGTWHGVFGTDGAGAEHIMVRAGAMRAPLLPPKVPHPPEVAETLYRDAPPASERDGGIQLHPETGAAAGQGHFRNLAIGHR
ncbi:MAG: hypothetical protein WDN06_16475 [Asticcacaulis sp.]